MTLKSKYALLILGVLLLLGSANAKSLAIDWSAHARFVATADTDTMDIHHGLPFPFSDESYGNPLYTPDGGLRLSNPPNIKTDVQYNPATGQYDIYQKMGGMDYRAPMSMDSDQYEDYLFSQSEHNYFKQKVQATALTQQQQKGLIPPIHIGGKAFEMIFGSNTVNIRPQGSAELIFGFNNSKVENPALPVIQRSLTTFNFNENIQLNVTGEIGDKLKLSTNYNTKATFDFQNQMKLGYSGHEDDIIKSIDAGNITFPLPGTLITGSQSLFGVKTKLQFGRLTSTVVYAQEKGDKKTITVQNGSQTSNFNIKVDQYQANQHYFLGLFWEQKYDSVLAHLPIINTTANITKIEVWVTNTTTQTQNTRDIIAYSDLGESSQNLTSPNLVSMSAGYVPGRLYPPSDTINSLDPFVQIHRNSGIQGPTTSIGVLQSEGFQQVTDFEKIDLARMLSPSEYTLNPKLGYISLRQPLNYDQVLAVAYQYTYNGKVYQVGQFSTDGVPPGNELMVKMLKSTNVSPHVPIWQLMMKNIYALGSYQINSQNFLLNIWYSNPATGVDIPYFPAGNVKDKLLLDVFKLDQLDQQGDRAPDGIFDFINGVTIDAPNGTVIFPSVEPFGKALARTLTLSGDENLVSSLVFQALYDSVLVVAQQQPNLDRYWIRGSFQSSASSDISLGALNVPPGSVIVTAGGIKLTENVDYTVDYTLGRVKILNQGLLSSGTPIQISLENNALFSIQSKTYAGAHFDYLVSKDFNLGATVVNYTEHPLTQIVSIGQEPVSNTMIGLNEDFKAEAPWLTRAIDALPFIHTKAPSEITTSTEVAGMIPGHPKYIGSTGTAYIDDFEGSESFIDISQPYSWSLASVPQLQTSAFPEAVYNDTMAGFNRAKVTWYVVDPMFQQPTSGLTPQNITTSQMANNNTRMVLQTEIFPQEQSPTGTPINLPVLNVGFYPALKGPYNYDVGPTRVSAGMDANGNLADPTSRWGGIMRPIQETDFETDNIGFIEFWMMDPYNSDNPASNQNNTGTLYFDLGDVSEDVLKDGQKSFENGYPTNATDYVNPANTNNPYAVTSWGRVPTNPSLVNAFDNNDASRPFQDIGLDGLQDSSEARFFSAYLAQIAAKYGTNSAIYQNALADPSNDDYHYYRGDDYDNANDSIIKRYMKYNGLEGNSPTQAQYANANPIGGDYPTTQSTLPNTEDINQDNTLSEDETYYEYQVQMTHSQINTSNVGNNFITNAFTTSVTAVDGSTKTVTWYQFKIPITDYIRKVGPISDFKSIRFIRMYFKGFDKPIYCRFGQLELVRDDWRKYTGTLLTPGDYVVNDQNTVFNMYGVNLEENAGRTPVSYVIPPGIQRQLNLQSANLVQQNEGSLALHVCDLPDGDARGVYKNEQLDLRAYKTLNMFVHCESADPAHPLKNGDVQGFIRLGSDFTNNYYEYAVPLQVTAPGTYSSTDATQQAAVWPSANQMTISLSVLENAKLARDVAMLTNSNISLQLPYYARDGNNIITVVGNPTISSVQIIMLGIRNPKRTVSDATVDDGLPKCTEVWFDELRMTDFNEQGGAAAVSRVTAKLADLGTLSISGNLTTPGFGSLEAKVGALSRETDEGIDIASNLEMGKFLPESWKVSVPMYVGYSNKVVIPEYNPLDPDILLSNELNSLNKRQQDSLKSLVISHTTRTSFNFTNVHKNKSATSKKSHIYDLSNFSANYSFSDLEHSDVNTKLSTTRNYMGGLTYNYSFHPKLIQPLAKTNFFKRRKYLALIGDLNLYPLPDRFTATANVTRQYIDFQMQSTIPGAENVYIPPAVSKTFNVVRNFNFSYPITKSLKLEYTATNDARVLEPEGMPITTQAQRDSVRNDFINHQTTTDFKQSVTVSYDVPINKIPFLDFVTLSAHYTGTYEWLHAPFAADTLGATIQNSGVRQINGSFNFNMLYNKVPFLKKYLADNNSSRKLPTVQAGGKNAPAQATNLQNNNSTSNVDTTHILLSYLAHFIASVKNLTVTYSNNVGGVLPGFNATPDFFGTNGSLGSSPSTWFPTPAVAFGMPIDTTMVKEHNWLVNLHSSLLTPFTTVNTSSFSLHASLEPIPDLKVDLTANRTSSLNTSQYLYDSAGHYFSTAYTETGNFSMSFFSLGTLFASSASGTANTSSIFQNYLTYREIISARLAQGNQSVYYPHFYNAASGFYDGYSGISQNVVIPAFIAAYSGQSPSKVSLNPFPNIPLPNWSINYTGLSKIKWVKKHLQSVVLTSAYTSNYSVGGYNYNLLFATDADGFPLSRDINGDFLPRDQIPTVSISDQLAPLAKLAITFKNNVMSNIEVRIERQVALNMSDLTVNEVHSTEFLVGAGYKIKSVLFPIKIGGKAIRNDLTLRADLSLRQNETILRNTLDLSNQVTGGQSIFSLKAQAEYNINPRLTLRLYFDKIINTPYISSSYPTSTMDGGIAIRFSLS